MSNPEPPKPGFLRWDGSAYDEAESSLIAPIRKARDHAHWLAVHRSSLLEGETAEHLKELLDLAMQMAWDVQGQIYRHEKARDTR